MCDAILQPFSSDLKSRCKIELVLLLAIGGRHSFFPCRYKMKEIITTDIEEGYHNNRNHPKEEEEKENHTTNSTRRRLSQGVHHIKPIIRKISALVVLLANPGHHSRGSRISLLIVKIYTMLV